MENTITKELTLRLKSLAVFRELLEDDVISGLCAFLDLADGGDQKALVSSYSEFVSRLYKTGSADLANHIADLVAKSENVYVRTLGCGVVPDAAIEKAVQNELKILQQVADLTKDKLLKEAKELSFLPDFISGECELLKSYQKRCASIQKFGYGIYAKNPMFYLDSAGRIVPVKHPDKTRLFDLVDYERERNLILENTRALLSGKPAANVLLTGDAGTGKSSTIKAVVNELFSEGLRIIELRKEQLTKIPEILDELSQNPLKFILFIDDLSFQKDDDSFNALKAVLGGSVSAKSENVVIYATSNRRHVVKERFSDREGDEIHRNDAMQEMISLSDRFGLHITFQRPDKAVFLRIVHHLAKEQNINMEEAELELLAERFALSRGGRSPRLAKQFIESLLSHR